MDGNEVFVDCPLVTQISIEEPLPGVVIGAFAYVIKKARGFCSSGHSLVAMSCGA